ncbi:MAG: ABC transporter ATP-binding protein [Fimbriimonadaceae bacterium]
MSAPIVEARAATLRYWDHGREVFACRSIDLAVAPGEFLGILGPSGSGKSSLLYLLSGLKLPTAGQVELDGLDLKAMTDERRSKIRLNEFGFVFQQPYLLGYLSALENVLVAQRGSGDEALDLLDRLGVGEKAHRLPHELSGGERQRVCVARALLGTPKVVFADEPTASLDHTNGLAVVELLHQHRGAGSVVMVTHDRSMLQPADRVVIIEDGRIQADAA